MTISSQNRQAGPYLGNGVASAFTFAFKVFAATDLQVVRANAAGAESTLTLTTDYTVTLNSNQDSNPGGTVTLVAGALASGTKLTITSNITTLQATDLTNQGGFYPKVITNALDKLTILIQQLFNSVGRQITVPISDGGVNVNLPSAGNRANMLLGFDANGNVQTFAPTSGAVNAGNLPFLPLGTGAVQRWAQDKMRESISALDFGVDNTGATDCFTAIANAWAYCLANGKNLYLPAGTYKTTANSFPFGRIDGSTPTSLLDCKNIFVFGDGPATILRTNSVSGADVIQLNGAKNLHLRNFKVTGTISGTAAGSNGISVTGGYDNVTLDSIWAENLPSLDKTTYIDGGKALTIQSPVAGQTLLCGTLKARNIFAKGCVYGFGLELDAVAASTMKTDIDVEIIAESCRQAVVVSAGAATAALPAAWSMGLRVKAQTINCMADVILNRAHGVDIDCQVITTQSQAQRILNYAGVKWFAADAITDVGGLTCAYAANSRVRIYGNKGACGYKAQVGGASAGLSGYSGNTEYSQIYVDLSGVATTGDFGEINFGGNITRYCTLIAAGGTGAPSAPHYAPARNNAIVTGNTQMVKDLLVQGAIKFAYTDGVTSYAQIGYDNEAVTVRQMLGSGGNLRVMKALNHTGNLVAGFRNDGALVCEGRATASAVGPVTGVLQVYDALNNLAGVVALHGSYTP